MGLERHIKPTAAVQALDEIRTLIRRHAGCERLSAAMPDMGLRSATSATIPNSTLFEPAFALVAQGEKRAILGDRVFNYGGGQFLVVSVALPIVAQIVHATPEEPYLAFAMALKPAVIAALLLEMAASPTPAARPIGLAVSEATPRLLDSIARLLRLIEEPADIAVLAPMHEREILWRLLHSEQGWIVRQIGLADSSLSQVSRAIRWIRTHFTERFKIDDPARIAGMSPASFYRHFRAVTAMSPLQYQKQVRLQEARVRLMSDRLDVASVGFSVGYENPSQFSREYSRMFGAPPGRDAQRLRATPAAELATI